MGSLLNSREWAIVTLLALLGVFVFLNPAARAHLPPLVKRLATRAVIVPVIALACWVALLVAGASRIGLWNSGLTKDTAVWFLASAFATIFAALKAAKIDHYFWSATKQAAGAAVFLQYAMNLYTFNYFVELALQVLFALLGGMLALTEHDARHRPVRPVVLTLGVLVFVPFVAFTARGLVRTWEDLDGHQLALGLGLSIWLPLVVLPFVWALAIFMTYQVLLQHMSRPVFGLTAPIRTRITTVMALGANLRAVNDLSTSPAELRAVASAGTWRDVHDAVRVYRRRRDRRRAEPALEAQRLVRFAGATGVDAAGRQLDQREIKGTQRALEWLATCHMGHHGNRGRYRADLMDVLGGFTNQGLPQQHEVHMEVSANGEHWHAWRRTPSGLVLGIGANSPPPDQWFYAAMEPPMGPPPNDAFWEQWTSTSPDWSR
jgi:hypothetical protein